MLDYFLVLEQGFFFFWSLTEISIFSSHSRQRSKYAHPSKCQSIPERICVCKTCEHQSSSQTIQTDYTFVPLFVFFPVSFSSTGFKVTPFFLLAVGSCVFVCVCVSMCVCVCVCVSVCVDSTRRYRWWDVAVCLTAVKNVRFSCRPLAPRLWPYVSLIAVWLHLIMPNSILLHSHRGGSNSNKTKKTSQISPKEGSDISWQALIGVLLSLFTWSRVSAIDLRRHLVSRFL